jgi:hypothetical protein
VRAILDLVLLARKVCFEKCRTTTTCGKRFL